MNKIEIRDSLINDLEKFTRSGGLVHILPSKEIKIKNPASCRYRRGVGSKQDNFKRSDLQMYFTGGK